jgi:alpha-D-ribose 1-methylphosphonate 5-triphosphate synthase subunit PhnI
MPGWSNAENYWNFIFEVFMYVAAKGGEKAIASAHELLARERRGNPAVPELTPDQIEGQLFLAVDRVMSEGSLYDRDLAARAIRQACGDLTEAVFLLRAYRTTLPRLGVSLPLDPATIYLRRRISAIFKDLPGGQILGPTFDYTHRLLDFEAADRPGERREDSPLNAKAPNPAESCPRAVDFLNPEGLIQQEIAEEAATDPGDLTREPLKFPAGRDIRLQNLARGDEGFLLALAYSTQRGFGKSHPFVGEIRSGMVSVFLEPEEVGFSVEIGEIEVTECQMVNQFTGSATAPPMFTRGYGLTFGKNEKKAMAMALVDRSLQVRELGEAADSPAQDEEFVLYHSDNVEASGFLQHLKLPHYVDFQAELGLLRGLRAKKDEKDREDKEDDRAKLDAGVEPEDRLRGFEPAGV